MSIIEILFAIATGGLGLIISMVVYNYKESVKDVKKLREEHDDLETEHHQTREQLVRLQERAVTREQMDAMVRDFEFKLEERFKTLNETINEKNRDVIDRLRDLKDMFSTAGKK